MTTTAAKKLVSPDGKPKLLPPVRPNVGLQVIYEKRLTRLIDCMHKSIMYRLKATYRANPPRLAQDSPASDFIDEMRTLGARWTKQFNEASVTLGRWFAEAAFKRSDAAMKDHLKAAGWTVSFKCTKVVQDVLTATMGQQVSLIKSIAQNHLNDVQGLVLRSVTEGGDLKTLTGQLQERYDLTKKRAALIARDQNVKATASITRVRQQELGLGAVWVHSRAGKEPRPTHIANSGKLYDPSKGWLDPAVNQRIFPGQLINCRCHSRSVIPGLDK